MSGDGVREETAHTILKDDLIIHFTPQTLVLATLITAVMIIVRLVCCSLNDEEETEQ